ncbi:MAG TPA: thioesterase domain-containing protein, partial [Kiritimatiellia bacterium]
RTVPGSDDLVEYRTGDRGRIHPDGCVEFLGRKDSRVKIRGFMVELADVEARVRSAPGVADAAVVSTNRDGETRLTAFVVPESPHALSPRDALKSLLPDYAIPSRFMNLPALPRTPGGKIDRSALSAMAVAQADPPRVHAPPRDALEMQLKIIWERALGADNIGVTDDFFDLGGHSMTALSVSSLVSRSLGIELPLATLARHATIEALANLLREKGWTAMNSPIVLLQAGGANPPLFCMPGAGSDVFALLDLARHLGDRPVYGLQHQGIDGDMQRRRKVEEMASHYVEHVERIQPQGPLHLAGGSFGGVVAFELARQLAARGRRVAFLGLLDSYGTNYPVLRNDLSPRRRLLVLLRWFLPVGNKSELTWANLRAGVIQRWERLKANLDLALGLRKESPPLALRFIYLMEVCFRARDQYTFPPFDGRIHLFHARTQPPEILYEQDPELGWHGCARNGIEVHDIPGRHGYLVREPNVATLAAAMDACMDAAEPDAHAAPTEYLAFVDRSREAWNRIGGWWDEQIGDEGNLATVQTLLPVTERILAA